MNKKIVDEEIELAREALKKCGVANNNTIIKTYRGQVSTFGAALTMGSLTSAIAFFSEKGSSSANIDRTYLLDAIFYVLKEKNIIKQEKDLMEFVLNSRKRNEEAIAKEDILNATTAIKLAMNLFELIDSK